MKIKKHIGELIPDLHIHGKPAPYHVLNERSIRATAGIMFLIGAFTFAYTLTTGDYRIINFVVVFFFLNFLIKVLWGPKYAPIAALGRLFVKKQKPEYVGAIQKRFAWSLGLIMSGTMLIITLGFDIRGIVPMIICGICLTLMWMETSLGICVGCKIYYFLVNKGILKEPAIRPACPGGACQLKH